MQLKEKESSPLFVESLDGEMHTNPLQLLSSFFATKEKNKSIEELALGKTASEKNICKRPVDVWISPDNARQFHSLYLYTGNGTNPIRGFDPDGNALRDGGSCGGCFAGGTFENFKGTVSITGGYLIAGQFTYGKNNGTTTYGGKIGVGTGFGVKYTPEDFSKKSGTTVSLSGSTGFDFGKSFGLGYGIEGLGTQNTDGTFFAGFKGSGGLGLGPLSTPDVEVQGGIGNLGLEGELKVDKSVSAGGGFFGLFGVEKTTDD